MHIFTVDPYKTGDDNKIKEVIHCVGWNEQQLQGQLKAVQEYVKDENCTVYVARQDEQVIGYILAKFHTWNRLGKIDGLVVNPQYQRLGIGSRLIENVEDFMKTKGARGIYVDTPADNERGKNFYEKKGYKLDYTMTDYYDTGKDGVTFLKLFI